MEPIFKREPYAAFAPQTATMYGGEEELSVSLFEVGHRLGDALIRSSEIGQEPKEEFADDE